MADKGGVSVNQAETALSTSCALSRLRALRSFRLAGQPLQEVQKLRQPLIGELIEQLLQLPASSHCGLLSALSIRQGRKDQK